MSSDQSSYSASPTKHNDKASIDFKHEVELQPLSPIFGPTRRITAPLIIDQQLDQYLHAGLSQQINLLEPDTPIRPPFAKEPLGLTGTQPLD